jgi:PAS domain S-box-containing protein
MGRVVGIPNATRDFSPENFAEEKFRLAVEACPSGMVMTDGAGIIVLVNTEAERQFGYRREELVGRTADILVPERLRGEYLKQRAVFALHPQVRRVQTRRELFGLRRDGTEFAVEVWLNPIHGSDGLFVLSVIVDISERKRIERLKDEFVSTVSHELRTPLTSISGSLDLLVAGVVVTLPEPALRLMRIAQINSQRLVRLINDILDVEKIESGELVFNVVRTDVRALVGQVIEANRAYADGYGVRVSLDPNSSAEAPADPDRLAQVVTNLLSNAIKFSPRGGEVVVSIEQRAETVRIAVRDHGDGIPTKFRPRIFERFAQADAGDARQKGGTGLGLSIVKDIVTRLGGIVGFDDAPGGGTVFHVELPDWASIARREVDADAAADALRILFCEDDPQAAMAVRNGLRPFGFATDFAHNPADAMARTRADAYAAILVDFELPGAGGLAFVRDLREQPQTYKTPIVMVSAEHDGMSDHAGDHVLKWLVKPVDIYQLVEILDDAVAYGTQGPPRILHVDDDDDVLDLVARALKSTACVTSADSIEQARDELVTSNFDLAILDITLGAVSGLDLLPELQRRDGAPIPVIVFSAHGAELAPNPQVEANLDKLRASLDDLVAAVHDRLRLRLSQSREEVA